MCPFASSARTGRDITGAERDGVYPEFSASNALGSLRFGAAAVLSDDDFVEAPARGASVGFSSPSAVSSSSLPSLPSSWSRTEREKQRREKSARIETGENDEHTGAGIPVTPKAWVPLDAAHHRRCRSRTHQTPPLLLASHATKHL